MQPTLPPPAAILFDLDGTLIDSIELIVRSFEHCTSTHLGAAHDRALIYPIIGLPLPDVLERVAPGQGDALLATYRAFYRQHHDALIGSYEGVAAMLDALASRGLPMGIVTSKSRMATLPSLAHFGLTERMATIVTHDDTMRHKPHPDPVLLAAAHLGIAPEACWYVGDSTHDMETARAAGMVAVGAGWGPYGRAALAPLADAVLDTPSDLLTLLP